MSEERGGCAVIPIYLLDNPTIDPRSKLLYVLLSSYAGGDDLPTVTYLANLMHVQDGVVAKLLAKLATTALNDLTTAYVKDVAQRIQAAAS